MIGLTVTQFILSRAMIDSQVFAVRVVRKAPGDLGLLIPGWPPGRAPGA
jgi:hypothetical protein